MAHVLLFIGTRRGLFIARSDAARERWSLSPPLLAGREVYDALLDPRDGRTAWAATQHRVWGAHVHRSDNQGVDWDVLEAAPHYGDERGMRAIWSLAPGSKGRPQTLFAGIEPAGLFVTEDGGSTWRGLSGLNEHETRDTWQPAGGSLSLHSIEVDPRDERRIFCALSAGGVYRSTDGGASWDPINRGVRAAFQPNELPESGQCVHKLRMHPLRPDRLYQQNHCGVYRSDDGGDSWHEITDGLPSDYGYALGIDRRDPDTVFVVPEESSHMRTTVDGRLRVYRSMDAGTSWSALTRGLPQANAYVGVLREALDTDALAPCGVYLGTSSGHVFASRDGGDEWSVIAEFLPRVLCVRAAVVPDQ